MEENKERVNHPTHYQFSNGVEVLDIARHLNFNCGNVVKYTCRAGKKQEEGIDILDKQIEDLEKAMFYLKDEIKRVKQIKQEWIEKQSRV